jgi:hypothetical protein
VDHHHQGWRAERYFSNRLWIFLARRRCLEERGHRARTLNEWEFTQYVSAGWQRVAGDLYYRLLLLDYDFRLLALGAPAGELYIDAEFAPAVANECHAIVAATQRQALATCEVCAQPALRRVTRPQPRTLCRFCWRSDRATAEARGERYANVLLDHFCLPDTQAPVPSEVLAWLDERGWS